MGRVNFGGVGGGDSGGSGVRGYTNTGKFDPNAYGGTDVGNTHISGRPDPRAQTAASSSPDTRGVAAGGAQFFPAGTPAPPGLRPVNQPGYGWPTMMGGYYA